MQIRELKAVERRLLGFVEQFRSLFGRSERRHWCKMYLCGLVLEGERKSIEPMAGRLPGGDKQALQQFVNQSPWGYLPVLDRLMELMVKVLKPSGEGVLVLDDTSLPKKGKHSVGVARQYCGALGKVANCQSVVSWHYAEKAVHFPLHAELYLPREWAKDRSRMKRAGVPCERWRFVEKWRLALALLDRIRDKLSYAVLVFDAGYGEIRPFLKELDEREERFIGQIPETHSFWPDDIAVIEASQPRGRRRRYPVVADPLARPLTARQWAERLVQEGRPWESVALPLKKKRVVQAIAIRVREVVQRAYRRPGPARWLVIEQWRGGGFKYYVSNLPERSAVTEMIRFAHERWKIEQGYQQLKEELGLDHFEGRSWQGLHHLSLARDVWTDLPLGSHRFRRPELVPGVVLG